MHDYYLLPCMRPQVIDLFPSKQAGIVGMAVSFSIARGIARPEGRSDPKKKSHQKIVLLLFFLVVGDINIGVYKYMKIHVTLMSIYQNSDMYIYTKKFIAHKINTFNYEDLNIFFQLLFSTTILFNFLQFFYIHYSTLQYFYLFFYFLCQKICTSHTHTHSDSLTYTQSLLIITHTHVQHDHHYITHIYTIYTHPLQRG